MYAILRKAVLVVKVLDHGYINLIEAWGSDSAIIEAAQGNLTRTRKSMRPNVRMSHAVTDDANRKP